VISIVQLTWNNRDQVRRFLPTVARLAESPEVAEWLVLDNGSTDGTADDLRAMSINCPKLRVLEQPTNLGCGGGRNVLWRAARADHVLSMDSDVDVTDPHCLPAMLADLDRPGIGIVGEHGGWVKPAWDWTVEAATTYVGPVSIVCGFAQLFPRAYVDQWTQREEYGPYWLDDSEFCLQILEGHDVTGWVSRYGLVHQWSQTNAGGRPAALAAWEQFRKRWHPAGLPCHPAPGASGPSGRGSRHPRTTPRRPGSRGRAPGGHYPPPASGPRRRSPRPF